MDNMLRAINEFGELLHAVNDPDLTPSQEIDIDLNARNLSYFVHFSFTGGT